MLNKLKFIKKKTITLNLICDIYNVYDHKKVCELVSKLIEDNIIIPIKASDYTDKYPRIKTKYKIVEVKVDNSFYENEIKLTLAPELRIDFYKKNILEYKKDRIFILQISDYIKQHGFFEGEQVSINERSYEVFRNEKFLMSKEGKLICSRLGLEMKDINVYMTPEPFFYTEFDNDGEILVIENKDTFITLSNYALTTNGNFKINNTVYNISLLIYGEGKKIISSFNTINYRVYFDKYKSKNILYWGDIDKEGFMIYESFKKKYNDFKIGLLEDVYKLMVKKYKDEERVSSTNKMQTNNYKNGIELDLDLKIFIIELVENKEYIPQEIITIREFKLE